MNTSHSQTLSIADPSRIPTDAAGARSQQPSGAGTSDSFSALYHNESASFDQESHNNNSNIKSLEDGRQSESDFVRAGQGASDEVDASHDNEANRQGLEVAETSLEESVNERAELEAHGLSGEDLAFETELLHGIGIALPSNSSRLETGEMFPLGGKELPLDSELSEQKPTLSMPGTEHELRDALAKAETGISGSGRIDSIEAGDRARQERQVDMPSLRTDSTSIEQSAEAAHSKVAADPLTESLTLLASKPTQENGNLLSSGANPIANLAALSQVDPATAQKTSLTTEAITNTDLSTNARSNSVDWSAPLGEKVRWMRSANISTAELHLHPAELGSIEIKIVTEDQQARISFVTSSAAARDIIEESMPKLRDLLADSGLAFEQGDISQRDGSEEQGRRDPQAIAEHRAIESESEREFIASPQATRIGQVDHYV